MSGVTENKGVSERWMQINHFLAALKQHLDLKMWPWQLSQQCRMWRVVAGLKLWVPHMWKKKQLLVNVCDGTIASDEMAQNVLSAWKTGEDPMTRFFTLFTAI